MAALDDLINKIDNPELKLQMQHVVRKLLKQKKFGLVFEDHLPESTILQEREVRVGLTVTYKSEPLKERFFVRAINNDIAECISLNDTTLTRAIPIGDLVPFATFGEPLPPLLTLKINVLANKYPNKYPKTNFFGYFSYIRVPIMKPEAPARLPALV